MRAKTHLFLFILFVAVLGMNSAMDDEKTTKINSNIDSDSLNIINDLIGEWLWDSTYCRRSKSVSIAEFYYKFNFSANKVLKVFENGELKKTARWTINRYKKGYKITTFPKIDYIAGEILIRKNSLKLKNNNNHGYDHFFSKCNTNSPMAKNKSSVFSESDVSIMIK